MHNHGDVNAGEHTIKQWAPKDRVLFDTSIFSKAHAQSKLSYSEAQKDGDSTPWLRGTRL